MDRAKIDLISDLRSQGFDGIAENILTILDAREKRIHELENRIEEFEHRYETVRLALDHFVKLELDHYTEILAAFPNGDVKGHKMYHDKLIKAAEAQEQFYLSMRNEVVKRGFFFALLALLGVIWVGFEVKIKSWLGL